MTKEDLVKKIEKEEKWLLQALNDRPYLAASYSVEIAFDTIKHHVKDYINSQQRKGIWKRMSDFPIDVDDRFECSCCRNVVHHRSVMDLCTFNRWCGRCGSENDYKKEMEE